MTALDILVLLLVGGGGLLGLYRGFVTEVLSLFAWVAAIIAIKLFFTPVSAWLAGPVGTNAGASVLAFALLFAVTFIGGKMLAAALGRRTRQSVLGPVDRALGFGFGALKGLLGATLLFLLASLVYDSAYGAQAERPGWMRDSHSYPLLRASGGAVVDWVARRRAQQPQADDAVANEAAR